jgi:hypothetical protein
VTYDVTLATFTRSAKVKVPGVSTRLGTKGPPMFRKENRSRFSMRTKSGAISVSNANGSVDACWALARSVALVADLAADFLRDYARLGRVSEATSSFMFGTPIPPTMSYPFLALYAPLLPLVISRKAAVPISG